MNDDPLPPGSAAPNFGPPPGQSSFAVPQVSVAASPVDQLRENSRTLQYAGFVLIVLAFPLMWWSVTRYRVYERRGVDLGSAEQIAAIEKDMDEEEKKEYYDRVGRYQREWTLNTSRFGQFYLDHFGDKYASRLNDEDSYDKSSGTLSLRGWSTWTGWFGVAFVVIMIASLIAPKFVDDLEELAWSFPWVGAILFGFYTLLAIVFYFSVPDDNGEGYSQGVGLGNYLALLGGMTATAGCAFEGMKTTAARLAALENEPEEEEEEEEPETPSPPKKNRLQDW